MHTFSGTSLCIYVDGGPISWVEVGGGKVPSDLTLASAPSGMAARYGQLFHSVRRLLCLTARSTTCLHLHRSMIDWPLEIAWGDASWHCCRAERLGWHHCRACQAGTPAELPGWHHYRVCRAAYGRDWHKPSWYSYQSWLDLGIAEMPPLTAAAVVMILNRWCL